MGRDEDDGRGAPAFTDGGAENRTVLATMSVASVSGFVMGLLVRGEAATALAAAVLASAMVWSGWWLRSAVPSAERPRRTMGSLEHPDEPADDRISHRRSYRRA